MSNEPKTSVSAILGDFDLFPEGLFTQLTEEQLSSVKELLLGNGVEETEIDLSGTP